MRSALPTSKREIGWNIILAVFCLFVGKFGLLFASVNPYVSVVRPETGVAIAILIIFGYRVWPAIFVGAFLNQFTSGGSVVISLFIAIGNTLAVLVGAYMINSMANGKRAFERVADTFNFLLSGGLITSIISATIGVSSLIVSGLAPIHNSGLIWIVWWLGDLAAATVVAPCIIMWATQPRRIPEGSDPRFRSASIWELLAAVTILIVVAQTVFGGLIPFISKNYTFSFLVIPPLVWIGLRFRRRVATTAVVLLSAIAIHGTLNGFGAFAKIDQEGSLIVLQIFLVIISSTILLLTVLLTERLSAYRSIDLRERHFHTLIEKSYSGIVLLDGKGIIRYASASTERILGYAPRELLGRSWLDLIHDPTGDESKIPTFMDFASRPRAVMNTEFRFERKDRSWIWIESTRNNLIADPDVSAIVINFRDITERKGIQEKKNQLVSLISSHLHTPLGLIQRYATFLSDRKGSLPIIDRKYVEAISHSSKEMGTMVENLLKISRLELGALNIEKRASNLKREIENAISRIMPALTAKEISLRRQYHQDGTMYKIDPAVFVPLLSTIMIRVIEHVPEKGTLIVETSKNTAGRTVVRIAGPGSNITRKKNVSDFGKADLLIAQAIAVHMGMDIVDESEKPKRAITVILPKQAPMVPVENKQAEDIGASAVQETKTAVTTRRSS